MKKPPNPAPYPCKITPCLPPRSYLSAIDVSPSLSSIPLYSVATNSGLTAVIGSTAPEGKPTTPQRRSRSTTVRFPAVSTLNPSSAVTDLVLQIQGSLQQEVSVAHLNRFEIVFTLNTCRESCFFTEHSVTEWTLLAVSFYFHLAVFRSEVQVCFFTFLFRAFCCNCLLCKPGALVPFSRLLRMSNLPSIVLTGVLWVVWGWSLGRLDYPFQDPSPLVLMFGIYYAALIGPVALANCLPLGMLFTCFFDNSVSYGTYLAWYFVVNIGYGSWFFYVLGVWFLVLGLHLMMLDQAHPGLCSRYGMMPLFVSNLLTILHVFIILAISGLCFALTRIFCCFSLLPLVGLEFTFWEVQPQLVLRLSSSGVTLRFNGLVVVTSSLLFVWLWWQELWFSSPYSQPRCMRPCLIFVPNKHALMCSLPIGMVDKSPYGGWFLSYTMGIPSSSCTDWLAFFLYWGLPLFWLSQLLERPNAPKHELLWSRFCWQLAVQIGWDEVKGTNPFVYEDMLSETTIVTSLDFPRDFCMLGWYTGTGTWPCYSWQTRRAASRPDACNRASEASDSTVVPYIFSLSCSVGMYGSFYVLFCSAGMYCSFNVTLSFSFQLEVPDMFVVERRHCITGEAVRCIYGCCTLSVTICTVSFFFRDLEQHLCVLGLCLMALDVHLWMLRSAHYRRCFSYILTV